MINTQQDLESLKGTPAYVEFMQLLAGSIYSITLNTESQQWELRTDYTTIDRFGLTIGDFPDVLPPDLPMYVAPEITVPQRVTNYQAKVALDSWQLLDELEAYIALPETPKRYKLAWASASFERQSDMVLGISELYGLTSGQIDQLFILAEGIN